MTKLRTTMRHYLILFGNEFLNVFVGRYIVEMGVSAAVIHFNDGVTGTKQVFSSLELTPGKHFAVCTCK